MRIPVRCLVPSIALLTLPPPASAASFDPLDTRSLLPPPPRFETTADGVAVPCPPPSAGTVFGVAEAVDLALCRNPKTHEAWANARAQAALVGAAHGAYLPDLDGKLATSEARGKTGPSTTNSTSLTLSWLLYDFGARAANLDNARQLLAAAASTLDATVQSVFLSALQAYYNTQAARAAVAAAQESERASQESLAAAETRYRVGTGTPADRLQAQTAWSQAVLNRIKAEGTLRNALGTLANAMGMDAGQPLVLADIPHTPPDTRFEHNVETLIAEARERRPDLRAAEAQFKAAQATVDATRASGLPSLSLGVGPTWQETRNTSGVATTHGNSIGLTLTIPFFSGFDTTYKVRSAQAKVDSVAAQREALRQQVALDVWTAYQNLNTATQTIRSTADLLSSAEQSERVALGRYKAGVGTILDLLNAQSALASARLQRIQALLDWNVSRATLAKAIGTLDSRLLNPDADARIP